jgi:hypothetical protein
MGGVLSIRANSSGSKLVNDHWRLRGTICHNAQIHSVSERRKLRLSLPLDGLDDDSDGGAGCAAVRTRRWLKNFGSIRLTWVRLLMV